MYYLSNDYENKDDGDEIDSDGNGPYICTYEQYVYNKLNVSFRKACIMYGCK